MALVYERKRVLITVKAYPAPARRTIESSCTAGITEDRKWIRMLIPFRLLEYGKRFKKYQWIDVEVTKGSDPRPESYRVNLDSLKVLGSQLSTSNKWQARKERVMSLFAPSLCHLIRTRRTTGTTLGIFKPRSIRRLIIEPEEQPQWTDRELGLLSQESMFDIKRHEVLEKIPFKFIYSYICNDPQCRGHRTSVVDWEAGQAYRSWRRSYGERWEVAFRQRFEAEMIYRRDTHFFVGTMRAHPDKWIIVGLFSPPL